MDHDHRPMNNDGRTTSEQLYIPSLLVVGGTQSLLLRCLHASKPLGLAIKACSPSEATAIVTRRHPVAIIVPNDVFEGADHELAALARDVRSALVPVDPEVSVRELEAMLTAAVDGGFSQHERRSGAGRYSIVDGIEEEAPFSRRTLPPDSPSGVRQTLPPSPGIVSTRPSAPPSPGLAGTRPSVPQPASMPPAAGAQKAVGAFAAIRSVFSTRR
jgi:hypothetical protein